jgi:FkbM family methyltransferase
VRCAGERQATGDGRRIILDVGANTGQSTQFFHRVLRGLRGVEIHACEPFAENFAALRSVTSGLQGVRAHNIALGAECCEMEVPLAPNSQWHSIPNRDVHSREGARIEVIRVNTLEAFCRAESIDRVTLLKTDTEGYDLEVLKGGRELLERQAIDLISCEVAFETHDLQHTFFPGVFDFLTGLGYKLYRIEDQWPSCVSYGMEPMIYANAWFIRPPS